MRNEHNLLAGRANGWGSTPMESVINSKNMERRFSSSISTLEERVEPMMVLTWNIPAEVSSGDFFYWFSSYIGAFYYFFF